MLGYLARKLVYGAVGAAVVGAGAYLTHAPDIAAWTLKGFLGALASGAVGAVLSNALGGSLSKQ